MHSTRRLPAVVLLSLIALASAALALQPCVAKSQTSSTDGWTRFRGPNGAGMGTVENLPDTWTDSDYNWKIELPGGGHSSPVVWQDRIYLSGGDDKSGERILFAVSTADGSVIWQRSYRSHTFAKHAFNSYASGTAAVDDRGVYYCWATPEEFTVTALSHDGQELWQQSLGPFVVQHGGGTSPLVADGRVFVFVDSDEEGGSGSFVTALDAASGETLWKTTHESTVCNYGTPLLYHPPNDQPPQLIIISQAQGMTSYDPKTGRVLWQLSDAAGQPLLKLRSVSSPYQAGDLLVASCGVGGGTGNSLVAVKPPTADGARPTLAFRIDKAAPYVPTGLCKDGLMFLFDDAGIATCVNAETGDVVWRNRLGGGFFGSPVCTDNRLICVSTKGEVVLLAASKDFQVLARNDLAEVCHSTPAIADGRLYVRTYSHLYSLGGRK